MCIQSEISVWKINISYFCDNGFSNEWGKRAQHFIFHKTIWKWTRLKCWSIVQRSGHTRWKSEKEMECKQSGNGKIMTIFIRSYRNEFNSHSVVSITCIWAIAFFSPCARQKNNTHTHTTTTVDDDYSDQNCNLCPNVIANDINTSFAIQRRHNWKLIFVYEIIIQMWGTCEHTFQVWIITILAQQFLWPI